MFTCCKTTKSKVHNIKPSKKYRIQLLMLGLSGAGKTASFNQIKYDDMKNPDPTIGFRCDSIDYKDCQFDIWECSGQPQFRKLWWHKFDIAEGLIYVIDSTDRDKLQETKEEFEKILNHEDFPKKIPVLVYATKMDLSNKLEEEEIYEELDLHNRESDRPCLLVVVSPNDKQSYIKGLEWIKAVITNTQQLDR